MNGNTSYKKSCSISSLNQCYKYRVGEYTAEGPKRNDWIYRRKCRQTSAIYRQCKKNTKIFIFFQFFKHLKQQEHQINTLLHEYGNKTDI